MVEFYAEVAAVAVKEACEQVPQMPASSKTASTIIKEVGRHVPEAIVFKAEGDEGCGIRKTRFSSDGRAWDLATIKGGVTLCAFDTSQNYFVSYSADINRLAIRHVPLIAKLLVEEYGWKLDDVEVVVPHQVTRSITERLMKIVGLPLEKAIITIRKYGNTAAASVPMALAHAVEEGRVKRDSKVMLVGGASRFSVGVIMAVF